MTAYRAEIDNLLAQATEQELKTIFLFINSFLRKPGEAPARECKAAAQTE